MRIELTICKASEATDLVKAAATFKPFDAVISIEHPGAHLLDAAKGRAPRMADEIGPEWRHRQLILTCWDVEYDLFGYPAPGADIVNDALVFLEKLPAVPRPLRLLIHCRSGKARSTALALVLLLAKHTDTPTPDKAIAELLRVRPIAAPNLAIVAHGDDMLGLTGTLVAAIEAHTGISERRADAARARLRQIESGGIQDRPAP